MTAPGPGGRRKHIPHRSCVICRETHPKRDLTRLVYTPATGLEIDKTGKAQGRGAYLCGKDDCWTKACRSDTLSKALKTVLSEQDRAVLSAYGTNNVSRIVTDHHD